jgi:hypothetical protein
MPVLKITGLHHDVLRKRSFVTVVWNDDPEKGLSLLVPSDCPVAQLKAETEKAVMALADELASATVEGPE